MTQSNLGNEYGKLARAEEKAENCKKAINAFEEALKIFMMEEFPEHYESVERDLKLLHVFCDGT